MKYDFESDQWPNEARVPYKLIRWWLLDCYYVYCQARIRPSKQPRKPWGENEHEIGYAYEQYQSAYQMPIERLMLEVLTLILNAGRGPVQLDSFHRKKIAEILAVNDL